MAVKSAIWVQAHLRRCFAAGLTGVVARRGAEEAGAVYVKVTLDRGRVRLFGPPPGPTYDDDGRRRWILLAEDEEFGGGIVEGRLARILNIDPDVWILDIDDRKGTGLLDIADV